jgi:hypothetical protein
LDGARALLKRLTGAVNDDAGGGMGDFGGARRRRHQRETRQNVRNSYNSGRRS